MYLARTIKSFPFSRVKQGSVVTIGAFDGLHLGHQRLLDRVQKEAAARNLATVVMSFEPTPKEYFSAGNPPARLTRFREKYAALERMGIDIFYCPNFNAAMRNIAADAFIRQLLVHALNVRHLVVGDDFRFARSREGNVAMLQQTGNALGFSVEHMSSVTVDGARVSSTAIRDALRNGNMAGAMRLLGNRYRMSGKVMHCQATKGEKQVNLITLQRRRSAVEGVFAVKVNGSHGNPLDAVACLGTCGTDSDRTTRFALHIPDLDRDLGGEHVDVDFIARMSADSQYDNIESLIAQSHRYMAEARTALAECDNQIEFLRNRKID